MSAYSNIDRETFNWVRSEIDVTIEAVRRELQQFVTSDDKQDLDGLVNHLHQVVGSLQMVELKSLSTLMVESELLLENFIVADSSIEKTSFCKLFESSLNVLDSSFARIEKGLPESPIEVVELINRIRELRGEEHVEISALFSPMIEVYPEVDSQRALKDKEYITRAAALRKLYQVYLLQWLKNADAKAVQRIRLVFEKLSQMSTFGSVSRIWWVATAYVDYLENNKLKNRLVHGRILRELDDHLRSLELQGESALVRDPGEELIKVMLFYIAMSETRTKKMEEIVEAFSLADYFPALQSDAVDIHLVRDQLSSLNSDVKTSLIRVRQLVTKYFEGDKADSDIIDEITDQFRIVLKETDGLEINVLSNVIAECSMSFEFLRGEDIERDDETGFYLASALMYLENTIDDPDHFDENAIRNGQQKLQGLRALNTQEEVTDQSDLEFTTSDRQALLDAVSAEVDGSLKGIESQVEQFSRDLTNTELLSGIDETIRQVRGAVQVLGEQKLGFFLQLVEDQFTLIESGEVEGTTELVEALAISIGVTEEYVKGLQAGRSNMDDLLDRGHSDLEVAVGKKVSRDDVETLLDESSDSLFSWLANQSDFELFTNLKLNLRDLSTLARKTGLNDLGQVIKEQNRLVDIISQEPAYLTDNITSNLQNNMASIAEELIQLYGTEDTAEEIAQDEELVYKRSAIDDADDELGVKFHDDMDLTELGDEVDISEVDEVSATEVGKQNAVDEQQAPKVDDVIFEAFLEESEEVLENANELHVQCLEDVNDREAIRDLRRAFHTMKGSSRMVGLNNIGEVAWFSESLFNYVLDTEKPLTKSILEFAKESIELFEEHLKDDYANQHTIDTAAWGVKTESIVLDEDQEASESDETGESDNDAVEEVITDDKANDVEDSVALVDADSTVSLPFENELSLADDLSLDDDEDVISFESTSESTPEPTLDPTEGELPDEELIELALDDDVESVVVGDEIAFDIDLEDTEELSVEASKTIEDEDALIEVDDLESNKDAVTDLDDDLDPLIDMSEMLSLTSELSEGSFDDLESASFSVLEDSRMRKIFVQEAQANLKKIGDQLSQKELLIEEDDVISISVHTLLGNARTMSLSKVASAYEKAEQFCIAKQESNQAISSKEKLGLANLVSATQACIDNRQEVKPYFECEEELWGKVDSELLEMLEGVKTQVGQAKDEQIITDISEHSDVERSSFDVPDSFSKVDLSEVVGVSADPLVTEDEIAQLEDSLVNDDPLTVEDFIEIEDSESTLSEDSLLAEDSIILDDSIVIDQDVDDGDAQDINIDEDFVLDFSSENSSLDIDGSLLNDESSDVELTDSSGIELTDSLVDLEDSTTLIDDVVIDLDNPEVEVSNNELEIELTEALPELTVSDDVVAIDVADEVELDNREIELTEALPELSDSSDDLEIAEIDSADFVNEDTAENIDDISNELDDEIIHAESTDVEDVETGLIETESSSEDTSDDIDALIESEIEDSLNVEDSLSVEDSLFGEAENIDDDQDLASKRVAAALNDLELSEDLLNDEASGLDASDDSSGDELDDMELSLQAFSDDLSSKKTLNDAEFEENTESESLIPDDLTDLVENDLSDIEAESDLDLSLGEEADSPEDNSVDDVDLQESNEVESSEEEIQEEVAEFTPEQLDDDYDPELREIFLEELGTLHLDLDNDVAQLTSLSQASTSMASIMRHLHTIKGSSLMANADTLGGVTHEVETYLENTFIRNDDDLREIRKTLELYIDTVDSALGAYQQNQSFKIPTELLDKLGLEADFSEKKTVVASLPDETVQIAQEVEADAAKKEEEKLNASIVDEVTQQIEQLEAQLIELNGDWTSANGWKTTQADVLDVYSEVNDLVVTNTELAPLQALLDDMRSYADQLTINNAAEYKESKRILSDAAELLFANSKKLLAGEDADITTDMRNQLQFDDQAQAINEESTITSKVDESTAQTMFVPGSGEKTLENAADVKRQARAAQERAAALRINTETLDSLTNFVGDASMNRSQMREDVVSVKSVIEELYNNVQRFGTQLRELEIEADTRISSRTNETVAKDRGEEFDPLELDRYTKLQQLSRGLTENLDELNDIQTALSGFVNKTETSLQKQDRLNRELQQEIMQVRLVTFGGIGPQLRQVIRRTSRELNKDVELELLGAEVRLDKTILDGVVPAIEHMLRNAVDHGIESPEDRKKKKKPKVGKVTVECRQVAREIVISIRDDGKGLNLEAIREKAIKDKLLAPDQPLKPEDMLMYISQSGFSTADSLTKISGRGVGMDVVQSTLRRMSGSISYDIEDKSPGSLFVIQLPISMAVSSAMFIYCGDEQFAIAARTIERVINLDADDLIKLLKADKPIIESAGQQYALIDLAEYLGYRSNLPLTDEKLSVVLVNAGVQNVAVIVDELDDTQEIVVKNLGSHLGRIPIYAGATIRANGQVVLLLDLIGISYYESLVSMPEISKEQGTSVFDIPNIMVVDDSLTVRKSAERDITGLGINVVLAKDGLDAQVQLRQEKPDMVLLDIEMPRMDGFELLEWIKSDSSLKDIPVVMISSRATEKYVNKATDLGCSGFLGKPYLLENLVAAFNQFLTLDTPIELDRDKKSK